MKKNLQIRENISPREYFPQDYFPARIFPFTVYKTPGQAAREAESLKGNKYAEQCTKHGINFSTIALEAYGGMGREAVGTLKKLVQICAMNSTVPHREIAGEMARRISTSVVVATAEALRAREASVAMDLVNPLPRTKPPPEMTEKPTPQEREPRLRAETEDFDRVGSNGLGAFGSCPIPDVNFLFIFFF